ncbi:hypothetical protein EJB05_12026, partial [Eragrostis curvula]
MPPAAPLIVLAALLPTLAAVANAEECCCRPVTELRPSLTPGHVCGDWQGSYAPGSAYEATLRHLAATIPAKVNAGSTNSSFGNSAGDSPNRIVASAVCYWRPDASSPDCGACVALAFREAQRLCPYHRMAEAVVDGGACKAYFHDYDLMEEYQHGPIPDNEGEVEYNNKDDFDPIAFVLG